MAVNPSLTLMLETKAGYDVRTPAGAERLCNDILAATGQRLGVNTVKRIVGILEYEGTHRPEILDIIALYLDYPSWRLLEADLGDRISEFSGDGVIDAETLPPSAKMEIGWDPGRRIIIRHVEGRLFKVEESVNSKLQTGDSLLLSQIATGFPLYVSDVVREGKSLGNYTAATINGIKSIDILQ